MHTHYRHDLYKGKAKTYQHACSLQAAERNIKRIIYALFVLAIVALVVMGGWARFPVSGSTLCTQGLFLFICAGLLALVGVGLSKFHGLYHHYHFEHQNNN